MKKWIIILGIVFSSTYALAEWDSTYIRDAGRTTQTETITVSSSASTALNTQSVNYVNMDIFNNSEQ